MSPRYLRVNIKFLQTKAQKRNKNVLTFFPGRGSNGVLVSKRSSSRRILLRGIFPSCRVTRGHDWTWKDQDGGGHGGTARPAPGKILDVQGWGQESGRSVANVSWPLTGITNVYRIGHKGKMDVRVAQGHPAATQGHYYPGQIFLRVGGLLWGEI